MDKQSKVPQQERGSKKTFPLDEANKVKQQQEEAEGIPGRPRDESRKTHRRAP